MAEFRFEETKVVVVDSMSASRSASRNALFEFGFREIELLDEMSRARDRLEGAADLLICEARGSGEECATLCADIRRGRLGGDVFLPIVATVWEPKAELVQCLVDGGVDLILSLPISRTKLGQAVRTLIKARKPFVVTSDYFGPDRRAEARAEGDEAPLVQAPNSLRRKATGDDEGVDAHDAMNTVRHRRVEAYVNRLLVTLDMISMAPEGHDGNGSNAKSQKVLVGELGDTARALGRSIRETRFRHQGELCDSISDVIKRISRPPSPLKKDLELVRQLALALQVAVHTDDESSATAVSDIAALVSAQGAAG